MILMVGAEGTFKSFLASLVANFNRSDHTPMEISDALVVQVTEGGRTQGEVARALGKHENWVSRYLSLQRLHPQLQALMHLSIPRAERLSPAAAFELARLPLERHKKWQDHYRPDPQQQAHLRAGIAEFRRLLERRR